MAPVVTVLMNCHNGEEYLREAIDSVYRQTFEDWEIVLWDNASTDGSAAIAAEYDGRLRYYRGDVKVLVGQARNFALEKARGEYIAFLDCDDIWLPEKLERQVPLFADLEVGLVYSDVLYFDRLGYEKPKYGTDAPPEGNVFERILFNNFICMSTVVMRGSIIKTQGHWFDPEFTIVEDTDLFMRIARDWSFGYAPFILCRYRVHEKSLSAGDPFLPRREEESLLEKFERAYPDFAEHYGDRCREQISRDYAVVEWRAGSGSAARTRIRPIMLWKAKYLLVYFATFIPYCVVRSIRGMLGQGWR